MKPQIMRSILQMFSVVASMRWANLETVTPRLDISLLN